MNELSIEGKIANHDESFTGRVEIDIDTGLITDVGRATGRADIVLYRGYIFSGFADVHVHAREDESGQMSYKEDYLTCSRAAINGGVAAFADMPNTLAAPVTDEIYLEKKEIAKRSLVDVTLYAGIGPDTEPLSLNVPYKVYMGPSVGDLFFTSRAELENVIKQYEGKNISFHCESPEVMEKYKDKATHEQQRPPEAEIVALDFALNLIEKYKLRGKICHISSREALEKVVSAKKKGLLVTCEVSPHHLFFDEEMLTDENRLWLEVNPPLRSPRDRAELLHGLKLGEIDFLATDHAPHTKEDKENHISGFPGLDTYGPFVSWLIRKHGFTAQEVAKFCAFNPGNFVNEFSAEKFGKVARGYVGSLTVLDIDRPVKISKFNIQTKSGWSPFEGVTFPGSVIYTIVRGKVYEHK